MVVLRESPSAVIARRRSMLTLRAAASGFSRERCTLGQTNRRSGAALHASLDNLRVSSHWLSTGPARRTIRYPGGNTLPASRLPSTCHGKAIQLFRLSVRMRVNLC